MSLLKRLRTIQFCEQLLALSEIWRYFARHIHAAQAVSTFTAYAECLEETEQKIRQKMENTANGNEVAT